MSKYSKEFKEESLKLSDEIGVKKAALQLGLQYYTLADWRKARKYAKKHTVVLTENEANAKICELERENAAAKSVPTTGTATTAAREIFSHGLNNSVDKWIWL